ncbi:MAG TPA: triose-phosphate isomerase [Ignavibacteriaceae bacterium]|nr:triose-phosphate isomerase [Ignavibacteriaceae bacterium]
MRKTVIAGNWKMYKDLNESQYLISKLTSGLSGKKLNCEVIICPPFTSLSEAWSLLKNTPIKLGAQNMYFRESGAFTGEISAKMLKSVGCEYVIIGHSERRTIFKETDGLINEKIKAALAVELKPIFCIGETLEEREAGQEKEILKKQLAGGLDEISLDQIRNIIIAYEPVWAIGTGRTATPVQAEEMHSFIRTYIKDDFTEEIAENLVIQYGGSVKPDNAGDLLAQKDIDGALVGGACLNADSFISIIESSGNK